VREGACGRRTAATPKPRPQAYLTLHRAARPCLVRIPAKPARAPSAESQKAAMPAVSVEIDTGSTSTRAQPPGRTWLIRLRRGHRSVITTIGLSRTSAEHLAEQITDLLAEPEPKVP
jgi:hypothetical protein